MGGRAAGVGWEQLNAAARGLPRAVRLSATGRLTTRGWNHPVRTQEPCSMCRRCETECPNQAFDADEGLSDPAKCIQCMHCVYICPDEVLEVDERMEAIHV